MRVTKGNHVSERIIKDIKTKQENWLKIYHKIRMYCLRHRKEYID